MKKRKSSYELLRIISMFLIIAWHYATTFSMKEGGVLATGLTGYHVFALIIGSWGQLGVDLFVILGIFFMSKGNRFKSKKMICIILETSFYALLWFVISTYCFNISVSLGELIRQILGAFTGTHWFITAYLLLYLFHPVLNTIIEKLDNKQLIQITVLLTLCGSIYKTIYTKAPVCDFLFFVNIYFLINCIERTNIKGTLVKSKKLAFISLLSLTGINLLILVMGEVTKSDLIKEHSIYLNHRGSVLVLIVAVLIFYAIKESDSFQSNIVNIIASTSLGVYLSHQGISQDVWKHLFIDDSLIGMEACLHMLYSIFIIFICCIIIDLIRQYTFEFVLVKILDIKHIKSALTKIDKFVNGYDEKDNSKNMEKHNLK